MALKVQLTDLASLQNEASATNTINANNKRVEDAIENTLSRDGTAPNAMGVDLDMNGNRISNLPIPVGDTEPVRLDSLEELVATGFSFGAVVEETPVSTDYLLFGDVSDSTTNKKATLAAMLTAITSVGGPGSSTDNAVARFNGTTGSTIQNSGVIVDDSNNVSGVAALTAGSLALTTDLPVTEGGTGASTAAGARTNLGLVIGTDVQAFDADTGALAANSTNGLWARTGAGTGSARTITGTAAQITVADGDGVAGNPTLSLPADVLIPTVLTVPNTGLHILDTNATHDLIVAPGSNLTADRTLTVTTGDADRTLDISAASVTVSSFGASLVDDAAASNARTTLGLAIGTDVQAFHARLADVSGITYNQGDILYYNGSNIVDLGPGTSGQFLRTLGAGNNPEWATLAGGGDLLSTNNLADVSSAATSFGNIGFGALPQGRITTTTATPVLTTTASAQTTVFYTPYMGNIVPIYNGTKFVPTVFTQLSQATADDTKSPAAATTNSNYDLFVWNDSGTVRCTRGPAWATGTSRGTGAGTTELVRVAGLLLNANSITNGPNTQRGTYVGTIRTNGSSQVDFILGAVAAGGTACFVGIWNMYNRVLHAGALGETTDSWNVSSASYAAVNGSSTMRVSFIRGLDEDAVDATYSALCQASATGGATLAIGLDSSTSFSGITGRIGANIFANPIAIYTNLPGLGFHFLQAVEQSNAGTASFRGDNGEPSVYQGGLNYKLWW